MLVSASCYASVCGAVPGTGVAFGYFGVPVPTTTPQNNGAAHGPRHPAYTDQILPNQLCRFCLVFVGLLVCLSIIVRISREKNLACRYLGPLSSGPCKVVLGLGVLGLPRGWVRCPDDLFFRTTSSGGPTDDRSCRRGFCVFLVLFLFDDFFELDTLEQNAGFA